MTDLKALVTSSKASRSDGAGGISPEEWRSIKAAYNASPASADTMRWLEEKDPGLAAALRSGTNYDGFTGLSIGGLPKASEVGDPSIWKGPDRRPPLIGGYNDNGLPKQGVGGKFEHRGESFDSGDPLPGSTTRGYNTNGNVTKIAKGTLDLSEHDIQRSRAAQDEMTTKMSGVVGGPVSNPPSVTEAKTYFQKMADNGASPEDIKKEFGRYNDTFFMHAGEGVTWKPKLETNNLDRRLGEQPIAKNGKRIIDCEGYSAFTEATLGRIKGRSGAKMFDVMHASGGGHVTTGVFPHGGDPRRGWVSDNGRPTPLRFGPDAQAAFDLQKTPDQREEFLMKQFMEKAHGVRLGTSNIDPDFRRASDGQG